MSKKVKIGVPMQTEILEKLIERAHDMGFGSAQAYIRFWAAAEVTGEHPLWGQQDLSSSRGQALRYCELLLAMHELEFVNMNRAMQYLIFEVRRANSKRLLHEMIASK